MIKASITFKVDTVEPADTLLPETDYSQAIETYLHGPIESCAWQHRPLVAARNNALMNALHCAYADHRPLILSPDHLWLFLCQGFSVHVRQNVETLRSQCVSHEGKKDIEVTRTDFQKGNPLNPWPEVVAECSAQVKKHLTQQRDLFTPTFSTTGPLETMAFEVTLLDAMQSYFSYGMTLCGIPSITLEGISEDWQEIVNRLQNFRAFGLDWWIDKAEVVMQEFVVAAEGHVNLDFWQQLYKRHSGSGGPFISGHILKLIPYVEKGYRNPYVEKEPLNEGFRDRGLTDAALPSGLSSAPFTLKDVSGTSNMEIIAGFIGIWQDANTKALRPEIGWAVRDIDAFNAYQEAKQLEQQKIWQAQREAQEEKKKRYPPLPGENPFQYSARISKLK